jgi:hydrogenase-4 component F
LYAASPSADGGLAGLSWVGLASAAAAMPHSFAVCGFLLVFCGLATKIGWAPVHNWLPDAHSEAPPPVSALLSAALLPTVMLVAWRTERALAPAIGAHLGRQVFIAFGLLSLAVAVPFLWRPLAWKRLLAYSSLEHMGVLALGIGFGGPLAIAGVVVHLVGHAVAKSLGFYAAVPLFALHPTARTAPVRGMLTDGPRVAASMSLSLGSLSGLPPSPLFFSEVLIIMGGFATGSKVSATLAAVLLALGFVGLAHVLVQDLLVAGRRTQRVDIAGARGLGALTIAAVVLLLGLAALALFLPDTTYIHSLVTDLL